MCASLSCKNQYSGTACPFKKQIDADARLADGLCVSAFVVENVELHERDAGTVCVFYGTFANRRTFREMGSETVADFGVWRVDEGAGRSDSEGETVSKVVETKPKIR